MTSALTGEGPGLDAQPAIPATAIDPIIKSAILILSIYRS
jgi:hypothetical protein